MKSSTRLRLTIHHRCLCRAALLLALAVPLIPRPGQAGPKDDFRQAQAAEGSGDYRTAISIYEALISQFPQDPKLRAALAQARLASKQPNLKGGLESQLKAVILPEVEFADADINSVFLYLTQKTDELTGGKLHPNFIYKGSNEDRTRPQITLRLANVPVSEVIRYVGELTGTSFAFEPHAVVGTPVAMLSKEPAVPAAK